MSTARPHKVKNIETLVPWFSAFLIQHRRMRFWLRALSNIAWVLGATVTYVFYFDAHSEAWMPVLAAAVLPANVLNALAFNRGLLKAMMTTFQTAQVCGHITIMVGSFCALCYNQPVKLAGFVLFLPSLLCAAFIDAYPAEGRAGTSRLFFTLNLIGLALLQGGLAFGVARIDEFVLEMYGGWRFKVSELAGGSINSLMPFGLRNLAASIHRPNTLAVRQSDVACVYMDQHALRVLRAVHAYLMSNDSAVCKGRPRRAERGTGRWRVGQSILRHNTH
jgi:hypothetical protein